MGLASAPHTYRAISGTCEQVTLTTTAATLASLVTGGEINNAATRVAVQADDGEIRFWDDGTTPTATAGIRLLEGQIRYFCHRDALRVEMIAVGSNVKLNITQQKLSDR